MPHIILTSRELPIPPLSAGNEPLEFRQMTEGVDMTGATALISTSLEKISAAQIAAFPNTVGLIANLGVGFDTIDREAAAARGIIVTNTPVVAEDTADHAFALILAVCRRLGEHERYVRAGKWPQEDPFISSRVHGKRLGLVGFGDIGQGVARRAKGFGMNVRYWNRSPRADAAKTLGASRVEDLNELLRQSDIISLHTAHTPDTHHIINSETLAACKKGAFLINTGRGGLIDEPALIAALISGQIAGAGLDVFDDEPSVRPEFLEMENVMLTPHSAALTEDCRMEIVMRGLMNVIKYIETGEVIDRVPPPHGVKSRRSNCHLMDTLLC